MTCFTLFTWAGQPRSAPDPFSAPWAGGLVPGAAGWAAQHALPAASTEGGGLALPALPPPRSWPETQQFLQEWITNKKPNNSYLRRFRLPLELSWAVSYSWQFILQEFSHLRLQWLMWWTFCPFPGKSLAWFSTPRAIFLQGLSSHFIFIYVSFSSILGWRKKAKVSWVYSNLQCNQKAVWWKQHLENKDGYWTRESLLEVVASWAEIWLEGAAL